MKPVERRTSVQKGDLELSSGSLKIFAQADSEDIALMQLQFLTAGGHALNQRPTG
ncbi:MAG: hypothetical protein HC888_13025 [Candidatus Competibacteraceae bacterium]|nr:hypothetical protein [Candidatus Competibacteraceae bacterium]